MEHNLIDLANAFHSLSKQLRLSAGARSLYYALLGEFNAAHFPATLSFSDRELQHLAGFKSVSSAHEARNVLKNHRLIDFTKGNVMNYQLRADHLPNKCRTGTEQLPNTYRTGAGNSSIRARGEGDLDGSISLSVREREKKFGQFEQLDALLDHWHEALHGGRLSFEHQARLQKLLEAHGFEWVKITMTDASNANEHSRGLSPKLFFAVAERKLKGGEKVVSISSSKKSRASGYSYKSVEQELPEWAS